MYMLKEKINCDALEVYIAPLIYLVVQLFLLVLKLDHVQY